MSGHDPDPRAEANRTMLRQIASACAARGEPLPMRVELAVIVGCTLRQVHRYVDALREAGHIETKRRNGRVYVGELRP